MKNTRKLIVTALFAALACVATMAVRIPTPGTGGYIHPGDAVVILCGIFLSPGPAFLSAGFGSCLADLLGGYMVYVPITFVIKGLAAFLGSHVFAALWKAGPEHPEWEDAGGKGAGRKEAAGKVRKGGTVFSRFPAVIACGMIDVVLVAGGYWLCESVLYGRAAALASVPANLLQGMGGLVMAALLFPALAAVPELRGLMTRQARGGGAKA